MELKLFAAGLATGLAMSIPVGAVNLLVIRTALKSGFRPALISGLGAVVADLLLSGVVVLGVTSIAHFMAKYAALLQILGGLLLVIVGTRTARQHISLDDIESSGHAAKLGLTFWLCISNPAIYFGYVAILGGLTQALGIERGDMKALLMVAGVGVGSFAWWMFLAFIVSRIGRSLSTNILDRINKWSGITVAALGFVLLMQAWPAITAWFVR
jgi:threonine/homoserine/homoserine lactone efflux protein